MTHKLNLFDPRGGRLCANVCEVCQEPLEEGSLLSTCPEHHMDAEEEGE